MRLFPLLACSVAAEEVLAPAEISSYDPSSAFVRFDHKCEENKAKTLSEHWKEKMEQLVAGENRIQPEKFMELLETHFERAAELISISHSNGGVKLKQPSLKSDLLKTTLGSMSEAVREKAILTAAFIYALAVVDQGEHVDILLQAHGENDAKLYEVLKTTKFSLTANKLASLVEKMTDTQKVFHPIISFDILDYVDIVRINNPFVKERFSLAAMELLPCVSVRLENDDRREETSALATMKEVNDNISGGMVKVELENGENAYIDMTNDPLNDNQWAYYGKAQQSEYGSYYYDGAAQILKYANTKPEQLNTEQYKGPMYSYADLGKHLPGLRVAVIDSGCYYEDEIKDVLWKNPEIKDCEKESVNSKQQSCFGKDVVHPSDNRVSGPGAYRGTAATALIAGRAGNAGGSHGSCVTCEVMCLRALSDQGYVSLNGVVAGVDTALKHGAQVIVINAMAYNPSGIELAALEYGAGHAGYPVSYVVPAGANQCKMTTQGGLKVTSVEGDQTAPESCGVYPAMYGLTNMFVVGASTKVGERYEKGGYGSDYVDIFFPGELYVNAGPVGNVEVDAFFVAAAFAGELAAGLSYVPKLPIAKAKTIVHGSVTVSQSLTDISKAPGVFNFLKFIKSIHSEASKPTNKETQKSGAVTFAVFGVITMVATFMM